MKNIPVHIKKLLKVYLLGLLVFFVFRLGLLFSEFGRLAQIPEDETFSLLFQSFLMGLRFDTVISAYILLLPFFVYFILDLFNLSSRITSQIVTVYLFLVYGLSFGLCAANIPYFSHFFEHLSIDALQWMDSPAVVFGMILGEPMYWGIGVPFVLLLVLYFRGLNKWRKNLFSPSGANNVLAFWKRSLLLLSLGFLLFMGMRGRMAIKSPIRIGTAYFSNHAFPNKLGLNPNFVYLKSYLDSKKARNKRLNFMEDGLALNKVQRALGVDPEKGALARFVPGDFLPKKMNVVLVIMESMSAVRMERFGNTENLTPFLDSLAKKSLSFDQIYTAGIHTYNGIYSSLFSFPALMNKHSMKFRR